MWVHRPVFGCTVYWGRASYGEVFGFTAELTSCKLDPTLKTSECKFAVKIK